MDILNIFLKMKIYRYNIYMYMLYMYILGSARNHSGLARERVVEKKEAAH